MTGPTSIYLIFGEEEYLVEQDLARVLSDIKSRGTEDLAVELVDCRESGIARAIQEIASPSLFSVNKVSVLKHFNLTRGKLASELEGFVGTGLAPGQYLVLVPGKVDKRLKIVKFVKAAGGLVESSRPSHGETVKWVCDRFKQHGKSITTSQARTIVDLRGDSLRGIDSEIDKIITYVGEARKITDGDIELLVGRSRTEKVFDLIRHVAEQDMSAALDTLADLLRVGESPIGIVFFLSQQLRWMIQARLFLAHAGIKWDGTMEAQAFIRAILPRFKRWTEQSGISAADSFLRRPPYVVYLGFKESTGFTVEDLVLLLEQILEANAMLVSTSAKPEVVLERFVAFLSVRT